ncbi:MAG: hypothetical protein ABSA21_10270 [Candidatus Limnocylindrales bacterium]
MNLGLSSDQITAVFGFFLPLLVAVIKKEKYKDSTNALIACVVYAVAAVILAYFTNSTLTVSSLLNSFLLVAGSGTFGYVALWKSTADTAIVTKINP